MELNIKKIEQIIGYKFKNEDLLIMAFTHSSFAHTHNLECNERLEFLGDSVLNFCTTQFLFDNFNFDEGDLSKTRAYLVSSEYVSKFIQKNNLINFLQCHNFNPQKSTNVMGDLFEAIVGAMLLDSDLEQCKKFIYKSLEFSDSLIKDLQSKTKDYKTELQEFLQESGSLNLNYKLIEKTGPAHMPQFTMAVEIDGIIYAYGTAKSKKEAENLAAQKALSIIKF